MPRLSAFVGRSFLDQDKGVWHELRDILDSLRAMEFEYEDAKEAQIRPISEKVKELIMRHEIYIGVLTKRYPIWEAPASWYERWIWPLGSYQPRAWTTSEWVIEEIGFAVGKDRKVLLLIEKGVNFPTADLDADTQWISFDRTNVSGSQTEITQAILNVLAQRVVSAPLPSVSTVAPSSPEEVTKREELPLFEQVKAMEKAALEGNFSKADELEEEALKSAAIAGEPQFWLAFMLRIRAQKGDTGALTRLKQLCQDDPSNADAIMELAKVYSSFEQFDQAKALLVSHLEKVAVEKRRMLTIEASKALRNDGKANEAFSLLLECVKNESDESGRVELYRELARTAEKANALDVQIGFLEKVLTITPSDNDSRFTLAYTYSNNDLEQLAAYHYDLVVTHTDWPGASNNLGVAYGALGFKASQHKLYKSASEKSSLARANLAGLYADAGVHVEAEALAKSVLANSPPDDTGIERARYVLSGIESSKKKELDAIAKIRDETRREREFMCAYADAFCAEPLPNETAIFAATRGDLTITREADALKGEGTFSVPTSRLGAMLAGHMNVPPEVKTYVVSLSAKLRGQSGTFEMKIAPKGERQTAATVLAGSNDVFTGLLYFRENGQVIEFLEREGKKRTIASARRKG